MTVLSGVVCRLYILLSYASVLLMPYTSHTVCCICLNAVFCTLVVTHSLFYSCVVQSHCFSITSFHHSLMCVSFCSALLRLPSSSFSCILSGLSIPGAFFVFSCACPSPSRSEHRGAHPDPSGGETAEDQSPAQAGGGQRYESGLNRMGLCLGKGCVFFLLYDMLSMIGN